LNILHAVTLQRSRRVLCTHMLDQVIMYEYPALADACSRDFSGTCFQLKRGRMNLQQVRSFLQG